MRKITLFCVGLTMLASVNGAFADLCAIGQPQETGSWTQQFNETGVGPFDLVALRMVSAGDTFESITHSGFTVGGWSIVYEDPSFLPTLATAAGPATTNMTWVIHFAGAKSDPLAMDFVAFNGETLLESVNASWNGSGWSFLSSTWTPERSQLVPLPAAVLLGMLGFGAAGMKLRKYA